MSLVSRQGTLVPVRGDLVLRAGDEVLLLTEAQDDAPLRALFAVH